MWEFLAPATAGGSAFDDGLVEVSVDEADVQVPVGVRLGEARDAELGGGVRVAGEGGLEGEGDRSGAFPDY
ncbi:hypothetical protein OG974_30215 (plasmid) [Streptomyces sp. NBC_00597]|uniref:hypothetical protein n=1 Tax=unclassified Streptomyces TaxID=2593676 RepID=UPI002E0FDB82|nr:hypothetical protein OG573_40215 [Streptomyces sp. NBC_01205]